LWKVQDIPVALDQHLFSSIRSHHNRAVERRLAHPAALHSKQALRERLVRPSKALGDELASHFKSMAAEFTQQRFGRDTQLLSMLLTQLVMLIRWEESQGIFIGAEPFDVDWNPVCRALEFLRENYADPVYAKEVARAAGVSESRLKILFRHSLNLSWVKYLQGYRIHRAAALLSDGRHNVTEAAMEVGFGSLSYFKETFRSFIGRARSTAYA
jgi:transcriptional regulator GlxA family with amidase domain